MAVSFPYFSTSYGFVATAKIDVQGANGSFYSFEWEIDSGSSISTLPASAAEMLGIVITSGKPLMLSGVSGDAIQVYVHNLNLRFHGTTQIYRVPVAIGTQEIPILLGREGVWDQIPEIIFNNQARQIEFVTSTGSPSIMPQTALQKYGPYIATGGVVAGSLLLIYALVPAVPSHKK